MAIPEEPMAFASECLQQTDKGALWTIPEHFNIGVDVCDRWAARTPDAPAIVFRDEDNGVCSTSFTELKQLSNRMANLFASLEFLQGDRAAVFLEQSVEVAVAHIAIYKSGGIAVPLFYLFGDDALVYRLSDSAANIVITDTAKAAKLLTLREQLPHLRHIIVVDGQCEGCIDWSLELLNHSGNFSPVDTLAEDPALIIYTSGTTGQPKGALHAHRVLFGHLPGVEMSHDGFPHAGDRIWTPADWAWIGGLLDVLLPALHHGVAVVAHRFARFEAGLAFELIEQMGVRNMFLPPTALRAMASIGDAADRWNLNVRSIASGGEPLGTELQTFCSEVFNVHVNEFYGQTECNMLVSSCHTLFSAKPGYMGKAVPGHDVQILDEEGAVAGIDEPGQIAVRSPDPVMLLHYWNKPEATEQKYIGQWLVTGDMGLKDADGYIKFIGRDDDIITSSGYRIGPAEVEDCLNHHQAVYRSAVIGKPDAKRTEIVKAFVVLNDAVEASQDLVEELQNHVKQKLAAHEYPREVEFIEALPMTTTGKIIRKALRDQA